jgi:hypothetical protein
MSKIEVNTVDAQCGSTITVGSSGKNVKIEGNDIRSNDYKASDGGNIINQSGTSITLGASGDTINLASGASQTGFGRTGTVDWQTGSIKTATFTAASGEGYFANTSGGAFTMNLPAGVVGAIVSVQDYNNTFDTHALTVDANGTEKINGGDGGFPVTLDTEGRGVTFVYVDATVGWRSVQDNDFTKAGLNAQFITATGGTITTVCTNFKVHTFTGPGTFTVCTVGNPGGSDSVDYMVLAGGGGGGSFNPSSNNGSGGGGGGYRESPGTVSSYTASPLGASPAVALPVTATGYPVTVGAGGSNGGSNSSGNKGSDSVFAGTTTITATGGGFGNGNPSCRVGGPGGSGGGGGGGAYNIAGGSGNTPPVSPPQGNNGGDSCPPSTPGPDQGGGGGGGAGAVGTQGTPGVSGGGPGGAGTTSSINGTPTTRGGGGGTGNGSGGPGGGGAGGASSPGSSGTANTGGGGGGVSANASAGAGGSGIVIIRYKFQ